MNSGIKPYFLSEYERVVQLVEKKRKESDIAFVIVADSHLSDNSENTWQNIRAVDNKVHFDFMIHLGDLLTGTTPEVITRKNLRDELRGYKNAIKRKTLYVVQGNHDGYRDESFQGQLVNDIMPDEKWYEETCFIDKETKNVCRPHHNPYYYVDYPELKLRLIILSSTCYEADFKEKRYVKKYEIENEQIVWLGRKALNTEKDYTIIVFSHIQPFAEEPFEKQKEAVKWISNYQDAVSLLEAYAKKRSANINGELYDYEHTGGNLIGWFFGHNHGDFHGIIEGINYVCTTSQTAYIPQLWSPIGTFPGPRDIGTENEDAWDAVLWNKGERTLFMYRFGAGFDRIIKY